MQALDDFEVDTEVEDEGEKAMQEWLAQRSGKLTCSRFGDLMGSGRGADAVFTQAGYSYLREVVSERLGSFKFSASASSLSWGHDNEAEAVKAYTETTNREVDYDSHRFVELTKHIGGSPDGLVGDDRCLEIKCPYNPGQHVETLLSNDIPKQYLWQCVGHCVVSNRPRCDFVSFDPRMTGPSRIVVIEFEPSQSMKDALVNRLAEAVEWIQEVITKIESPKA